jgi:ATP-dependent DNA ligase
MLAYPTEPGRVARLGEQFLVQPKLNGERARVEWFHGEPILLSSYANVIKGLDHIAEDLVKLAKTTGESKFDGELYIHGKTWSQITSICGRTVNEHPDAHTMQYHIFDTQNENRIQIDRSMMLMKYLQNKEEEYPSLRYVPTYSAGQETWGEYAQRFVDDDYEGIILRALTAPYHYKRNVCLLKYKPTETDEYVIDEVLEAIDKEGNPKGMVGAFLVHGDDNTVFKVGAGKMKHNERIALWEKRQKLTWRTLIVKHEKLRTVNDIPIAAVACSVKGEI